MSLGLQVGAISQSNLLLVKIFIKRHPLYFIEIPKGSGFSNVYSKGCIFDTSIYQGMASFFALRFKDKACLNDLIR